MKLQEGYGRSERNYQGKLDEAPREIPSVLVVLEAVRADSPAHMWTKDETNVCASVEKAKKAIGGRSDIKIFLALVQLNDSIPRHMQSPDKLELANERITALRKRCELDAKCALLLYSGDVDSGEQPTTTLRKLFKSIKEMSVEHYRVVCRRIKSYRGRVDKHSAGGCALLIRYNFKVAQYYEAREHTAKTLRHYNAAYKAVQSLHDMMLHSPEAFQISEREIFRIAEVVHLRTCLVYAEGGNVQKAVEQFSAHTERFCTGKVPSGDFERAAFISRQYDVFDEL